MSTVEAPPAENPPSGATADSKPSQDASPAAVLNTHFVHPAPPPPMPWELPLEERKAVSKDPRMVKQREDENQWNGTVVEDIWKTVIRQFALPQNNWLMDKAVFENMLTSIGITSSTLKKKLMALFDPKEEEVYNGLVVAKWLLVILTATGSTVIREANVKYDPTIRAETERLTRLKEQVERQAQLGAMAAQQSTVTSASPNQGRNRMNRSPPPTQQQQQPNPADSSGLSAEGQSFLATLRSALDGNDSYTDLDITLGQDTSTLRSAFGDTTGDPLSPKGKAESDLRDREIVLSHCFNQFDRPYGTLSIAVDSLVRAKLAEVETVVPYNPDAKPKKKGKDALPPRMHSGATYPMVEAMKSMITRGFFGEVEVTFVEFQRVFLQQSELAVVFVRPIFEAIATVYNSTHLPHLPRRFLMLAEPAPAPAEMYDADSFLLQAAITKAATGGDTKSKKKGGKNK